MNKDMNRVIEITRKHTLFLKEETIQFDESGLDFKLFLHKTKTELIGC